MRTAMLAIVAATFLITAVSAADFGSLRLASGKQQVLLLELYTSEGCSSCPPADRWLSTLKSERGLWREFIPIALHVDYWNYIGWDDRFARKEFSNRQQQYVQQGAARVPYTPGFFSGGEEWLGWRSGRVPVGTDTDVGELSLQLDGLSVAATFAPAASRSEEMILHVAILGMRIETEVKAGENKGKTLQHDFVALDVQAVAMNVTAGGFEASTKLHRVDSETDRLALVAWVSTAESLTPLQAVGAYLPRSN